MHAVALAVISLPSLATTARAQTPLSLACGLEPGPERAVVSVLDGDTVRLDDGKVLRLIGIMAPKALDTGTDTKQWPVADAARRALETELQGHTVSLAFSGARTDRHNRILAHIFSSSGNDVRWLQRIIIEAGHARVLSPPGQGGCAAPLLQAERIARTASRGLWANAAYQIRPGDRPTELQRYIGTFQIISGSVQRIIQGRSLVIVELTNSENRAGANDQRDFGALRLTVPRAPKSATSRVSKLAAGTMIEARGWITPGRTGPEIEILADDEIAVLQDPEPETATGIGQNSGVPSNKRKRPEAEPLGEPKE